MNNLHGKLRTILVGSNPQSLNDLMKKACEAELALKQREKEKAMAKYAEDRNMGKAVANQKKKEVMVIKAQEKGEASRAKPKLIQGDNYEKPKIIPLKDRLAKKYSFDADDTEDIFRMLLQRGKIALPEPKRPHEVGNDGNPKYCPYHRCISHNIRDCYVLKDKIESLIAAGVITLHNMEKPVGVNTISMQFGTMQETSVQVEDHSKEVEFKLVNSAPKAKELSLVEVAGGEIMWVHHDLLKDENWEKSHVVSRKHKQGSSSSKQAHKPTEEWDNHFIPQYLAAMATCTDMPLTIIHAVSNVISQNEHRSHSPDSDDSDKTTWINRRSPAKEMEHPDFGRGSKAYAQ